jgi:hypothetical protein
VIIVNNLACTLAREINVVSSHLARGADERIVVHVATDESFRSVHPTKNIVALVDIRKPVAVPVVVTTAVVLPCTPTNIKPNKQW